MDSPLTLERAWSHQALETVRLVANASLSALSTLNGTQLLAPSLGRSRVQKAVQQRAVRKAEGLLWRLRAADREDGRLAFGKLIQDEAITGDAPTAKLNADQVDVFDGSGRVDPLRFVDKTWQDILHDPGTLFPDVPKGTIVTGRVNRDRREYARLVVRQLRAGKVGLADSVLAAEPTFVIGKTGGRLREIWSGSRLSAAARPPPKPPLLASPSALLALEASTDDPVRVYKRDAACFFDQLGLPQALHRWFGRPRVPVSDLLRFSEVSLEELRTFWVGDVELDATAVAHPFCKTWPMGFAWSSFLAQSTLLWHCFAGGLRRDLALADDVMPPARTRLAFGLATDDLMLFARGNQRRARALLRTVDREVERAGIIGHPGKDVNEEVSATVIGVDVVDGIALGPNLPKLTRILVGLAFFFGVGPLISPLELHAVLGHMSWMAMLNRHLFACFARVYDFTSSLGEERVVLPDGARFELLLFVALLPWLVADLTRGWQSHIVASDASQSFGFGVAIAPAPTEVVRELGRRATRPGMFVRLDRSDGYVDDEPERARRGVAYTLPISKAAFRTVVSAKARYRAHAGALEAQAGILAVKWVLQSPQRHAKRTVVLIDAQAVCGAFAKGRSSSALFGRELRRLAALCVAGDLWLRVLYVPSEDNPADAPSRGIVRRWRARGSCVPGSCRKRFHGALLCANKVSKKDKRDHRRGQRDDGTARFVREVDGTIHRLTHMGTKEQQNRWRRLLRDNDWSDVSSLSSVSSSSSP